MSRFAVCLVSVLLLAGSVKATHAEEPYKTWWKFMQGEWTYKVSPMNDTGTAIWRITAKGHALVGRFKGDNGETAIELAGWKADSKTEVATGFGSEGNYWTIVVTKHSVDAFEADNTGMLPDGTKYNGKFVGHKVDENHYEWEFKGKTAMGEDLTMTGKYTRKAN